MPSMYECVDDIMNELMVHLPGAPAATIKQAVGVALREFLVESVAWRVQLSPFTMRAAKEDYYLDPPFSNTRILYIHGIKVRVGSKWEPLTALTDDQYASTPQATGANLPMYFKGYADVPGKVAISPMLADDAIGVIKPTVSLVFKDPWDGQIPVFIMRYWREVLHDGVLGKMMQHQDKPYTNAQLSGYHMRRFRSGITRARDMAARQYTEAESSIIFPRWAQ